MADTLDELIAGVQNYIVAPLNAFGLGGFVFDVEGESRATISAEITDHYTEDNKALQDHIAIKPKRITLKGYVGELVFTGANGSSTTILQSVTQKLTEVSAFLPQLSAAAVQAQAALANPSNSTLTLNSIAGQLPSAANIYGLIKNVLSATGNQARQQNAYNYFVACQQQQILMGIQTPWEFLTNMAIETIDAIQDEDSIYVTDFSITYKQIRIAQTQTAASPLSGTGGIVPAGGPIAQGVSAVQSQLPVSQGIVPGMTLPSQVISGIPANITSYHSLTTVPGLQNLFKVN